MSYVKKVQGKLRLHVSVNLLFGGWLHCRCLHRAYVPMSNTASHDNHEKINSWVSFSFLYGYGAPFGGPSRPFRPPELRYEVIERVAGCSYEAIMEILHECYGNLAAVAAACIENLVQSCLTTLDWLHSWITTLDCKTLPSNWRQRQRDSAAAMSKKRAPWQTWSKSSDDCQVIYSINGEMFPTASEKMEEAHDYQT